MSGRLRPQCEWNLRIFRRELVRWVIGFDGGPILRFGQMDRDTDNADRAFQSQGKVVHPIEFRNHPKTGDPMIVVDGDAYVTAYQKRPW
ncbi:hypothetical protein BH18ACI3_BH18ACI3_19430 [soil metagenome]